MVPFSLWSQSLILVGLFFLGVGLPCIFLALIGKKIIYQLGHYPTKTALILKSFDFLKFILISGASLIFLIACFFILQN